MGEQNTRGDMKVLRAQFTLKSAEAGALREERDDLRAEVARLTREVEWLRENDNRLTDERDGTTQWATLWKREAKHLWKELDCLLAAHQNLTKGYRRVRQERDAAYRRGVADSAGAVEAVRDERIGAAKQNREAGCHEAANAISLQAATITTALQDILALTEPATPQQPGEGPRPFILIDRPGMAPQVKQPAPGGEVEMLREAREAYPEARLTVLHYQAEHPTPLWPTSEREALLVADAAAPTEPPQRGDGEGDRNQPGARPHNPRSETMSELKMGDAVALKEGYGMDGLTGTFINAAENGKALVDLDDTDVYPKAYWRNHPSGYTEVPIEALKRAG